MARPIGFVVWEGPGFDGHPCAVIVTGLSGRSKNAKTGDMLQTWILRVDTPPHAAVREGLDVSVCGTCPLASGNGCYVRVEQAPLAVWKAYHAGRYPRLVGRSQVVRVLTLAARGRKLRVGSYGDPAVPPAWVWHALIQGTQAPKRTGYTHAWVSPHEANLQQVCMASVHTADEAASAHALGYRTFRTGDDGPLPGEIVCPATPEGGEKTTCAECGLCDGSKGPNDRRKNIFAYLHGAKKSRALLAIGG